MSLFGDPTSADPTRDFNDISWCDGQCGPGSQSTITATVGPLTVTQVTYEGAGASTGMATAVRLFTLVNNNAANGLNWDQPIVVLPLNGGINPFTGTDITSVAGETFQDTGVTPNVITVAYDVSNAGGSGLFAYDTGGNQITFPRNVILYHELSHAYHYAINQIPFPQAACPGNTTDEPAAEIDENVFRSQLGLCQRDVCNHGGGIGSGDTCGGDSRPPCATAAAGSGSSNGNGCFIVSAATESSKSIEISRLRELRDRISGVSMLSAQLIDGIYLEYFRFSPGIATELKENALARMAVRRFVVKPLLAWYTLACTVGLKLADRNAVSEAAQDVLDACPRYFGTRVGPLLEAIRAGGPLPQDVPQPLLDYLPRIREATRLPLASWAILDALTRAWTLTSRHADVLGDVAEWLAAAPLESVMPPGDLERLDSELGVIAGFLDFQPRARTQVGARLAKAWPQATNLLKRHGFI